MESQPQVHIAYYQVSTKQQGQSGLGLEAQRTQVMGFISGQAQLVREFIKSKVASVTAALDS
jgi:hypothetical protein